MIGVTLGLAALVPMAGPVRAADVYVQLTPSTTEAGDLVGIRASCRDNRQPATVESQAFGTVTAQPQDGVLTATAMVPEGTKADTYRVRLRCPDGNNATASLIVVGGIRPTRGPATGFGGTAGDNPGGLLIAGGLATLVLGGVLGVLALRQRSASFGPR
ncbi:hypothetical protein [Plantactinospora sp. GCM10030261]|uniref:hypothetical protein n=1 Tax=Plantactinospora sp. GCM10030261 TaxID=3273420 RepID=UPI00360B430E